MKIATWNVNSLKVRQQHVMDWLKQSQVDVLCLQELKLPNEKFPCAEFEAAGFKCWFAGQKTYNGVGILVRKGIAVDETNIVRNIPGFEDPQQRVIAATVEDMRIVSAYFPNGQAVGSEKFAYKMRWLDALHDWLGAEMEIHPKLGAPRRLQHRARRSRRPRSESVGRPESRVAGGARALRALVELGLMDAFRQFEQPEKLFTWWDYRMLAFRRNAGLRIDHILLSAKHSPRSARPAKSTRCRASGSSRRTTRRWSRRSADDGLTT